MKLMNKKQANKELKKGYKKAEKLIKDKDKTEEFLQKLEKKLKEIPKLGNTLSMVPILISLVRSYIKGEYKNVPLGTIIAIISALLYVFMMLDFIPDSIPGAGYIDDALVIGACLRLIRSDVEEYQKYRKDNNLI
ncbi:MAG: DUF1232 domain-containing protein [Bacilli bacterium]|nr:DUF1232 domain-containing protein [Bacilli bacterium]